MLLESLCRLSQCVENNRSAGQTHESHFTFQQRADLQLLAGQIRL